MKKLLSILALTVLLSPITTTYEDGSKTVETVTSHVVYKYIQVPLAHLNN